MREKRAKVAKAAVDLVRASNPQDEVFVVNFSDEYYLDQPFTSKLNLLQEALEKYETRGGTALYDAIVASADELKKHGKLVEEDPVCLTDGEDDASRESLEQAVRRLQERKRTHGLRHRRSRGGTPSAEPKRPWKQSLSVRAVSLSFPAGSKKSMPSAAPWRGYSRSVHHWL